MDQYAILDKIAQEIANTTYRIINHKALETDSNVPYKNQYVLEEVIKILQARV